MHPKNFIAVITIFLIGISSSLHAQTNQVYPLDFNPGKYETQIIKADSTSITVRAYEKIIYVAKPVDTTYEVMNIYIPEAYFEGKSIHGYTAATAPIFFPNKIGGYMPGLPATALQQKDDFPGGGMMPDGMPQPNGMRPPNDTNTMKRAQGGMGGPMGSKQQSAVFTALSKGYIVASAGARGRTTKDKTGIYTGKAPAAIVDLKAAIRYLKYNDAKMPGDANKIISNGTSAGGAMSVLLGATGNHADYEPYLKALGAAKATDDIFAVSAYCPITNLDNADAAYEWQFNGVNSYVQRSMGMPTGSAGTSNVLSQQQIEVSEQLKKLFPDYVNSLRLTDNRSNALTLDENGNGTFKDWVKSFVIASAQKALDKGTNLSSLDWIINSNSKITDIDFDAYVRYMQRMKTPPAFDALDLSTGEDQLFGTSSIDKQHFTKFASDYSTVKVTTADKTVVKMMNPMYYIGQSKTAVSKYWRIRHGTKDKDTGLGIPVILATCLQNKGYNVDFALPWDKPHSGDYDLDELFAWIDSICK